MVASADWYMASWGGGGGDCICIDLANRLFPGCPEGLMNLWGCQGWHLQTGKWLLCAAGAHGGEPIQMAAAAGGHKLDPDVHTGPWRSHTASTMATDAPLNGQQPAGMAAGIGWGHPGVQAKFEARVGSAGGGVGSNLGRVFAASIPLSIKVPHLIPPSDARSADLSQHSAPTPRKRQHHPGELLCLPESP
jgi:hypothetical protein